MRGRLTHAELLLQSYGITDPQDIDIETLAFLSGAEVREERLSGCEAKIYGRKDKAIILVNANSSFERKRFSIAHELGHWHHHRGQALACRGDEAQIGNNCVFSITHPERVADEYASSLLMPGYMFSSLAKKCEHACFDAILDFKKRFITSITATALRFVEFSPEPCMLVCYDRNGNRKWFKPNREVPDKLFPHERLDKDTIAYDVLNKKQSSNRPSSIPADAWFEGDDLSRFFIYEETIRIHDGRILTLLTWRSERMFEKYY